MGAQPASQSGESPEFLDLAQVAEVLAMSEQEVLARVRVLQGVEEQGRWRFPAAIVAEVARVWSESPEEFAEHTRQLFERMGRHLREAGVTDEDITRTIEEVRRERRARNREARARA